MSKRGDLKFILPKEGSSNVSLPKGFSSKITKTIDLHIEDFLGKLNEAVQKQWVLTNFIQSPRFLIGHQEVLVSCWFNEAEDNNFVMLDVGDGDYSCAHLKSILVTGNCGNLTLKKRRDADNGVNWKKDLAVEIGSIKELKEAMTTTGNHKLDLQVTATVVVPENSDEDQWIFPR